MIIVNSDDFGASKEINLATYLAFQQKLISSTTALMNFEPGIDDAVSYVNSGKIDEKSVGVHLNLTAGEPLTKKIINNPKLCISGVFKNNRNTSNFKLDNYSMECIYEEFDAQIKFFKEKFGFPPSHIDSHQHIHTKWPILQCVVRVAKKHDIKSIRLSRNISDSGSIVKKGYKMLINNFLRFKGFKVTDKFGDINEAIAKGIDFKKKYEIMVHVQNSDVGEDVLDVDGKLLREKLREMYKAKQWEMINYSML